MSPHAKRASSARSTVTRWNERQPANGIVGPGSTTSVAPASTAISHCCVLNDFSDGWIRVADWPTIMVRVPFFAVTRTRWPSPSKRPAVGLMR